MNKVLIIGSGGREKALCRQLSSVCDVSLSREISDFDISGLSKLSEGFDLVIPGPELPLSLGVADTILTPCCGPSKVATELESSKVFTRELCLLTGVPSPKSLSFGRGTHIDLLTKFIDGFCNVPVFKLSNLAGGKGVILPDTKEELLEIIKKFQWGDFKNHFSALLEERLVGTEASLFFACCGNKAIPLPTAKDYKRINDNNQGPNTGGMGAISPHPDIDDDFVDLVRRTIVEPILTKMIWIGRPFKGFLFVGVMITEDGPNLLEFNVRLGDPEAQVILPRINPRDLLDLCDKIAHYSIPDKIEFDPTSTCCVVMAAPGYPDKPILGGEFTDDVSSGWVNRSAVVVKDGKSYMNGGRTLGVVNVGNTIDEAIKNCYLSVGEINGDFHYRTDIGS